MARGGPQVSAAGNWAIIVGTLWLVYVMIRPNRSGAAVVAAMGQSYASTLRAALGAVESRDPLAPQIVSLLDEETRTDVLTLLSPADRLWIDTQMMIGDL